MKLKSLYFTLLSVLIGSCARDNIEINRTACYSTEQELKKNFVIFSPIEFDTLLLDFYGDKLVSIIDEDHLQWYLSIKNSSTFIKTLLPIEVSGDVSGYSINYYPTIDQIYSFYNYKKAVIQIDTANFEARIPRMRKVLILKTGENEISLVRTNIFVKLAFTSKYN